MVKALGIWPYAPIVVPKQREAGESNTAKSNLHKFSGTVHGVDILDFVQFLLLSGISTLVEINTDEGLECTLHLHDGRVVHARYGPEDGKEAFIDCMTLSGGRFATKEWQEPDKRSIDAPSDLLLFEAAQRRDEISSESTLHLDKEENEPNTEPDTDDFRDHVVSLLGTWKPVGPFPIYDVQNSMKPGNMVEIRGNNLIVADIQSEVGAQKEFLIKVENAVGAQSLVFTAECLWSERIREYWLAGFKIVTITDEAMQGLENFLKSAALLKM